MIQVLSPVLLDPTGEEAYVRWETVRGVERTVRAVVRRADLNMMTSGCGCGCYVCVVTVCRIWMGWRVEEEQNEETC
jgi:hypothetical protein